MGKGIDAAREAEPGMPHHDLLDDMKEQLIIALLKRLMDKDGNVFMPVAEVDDTGGDIMMFAVDLKARVFQFHVRKKQ